MFTIKITITSFIDNDYPGFVEARLCDVWNREHIFQEKVPVISLEDLDADSNYPRQGIIACEVVRAWADVEGRRIVTVNTDKPWSIESIEGISEFDLEESQLTETIN